MRILFVLIFATVLSCSTAFADTQACQKYFAFAGTFEAGLPENIGQLFELERQCKASRTQSNSKNFNKQGSFKTTKPAFKAFVPKRSKSCDYDAYGRKYCASCIYDDRGKPTCEVKYQ
jgi:hypothetical protein